MNKVLLLSASFCLLAISGMAQKGKYWTIADADPSDLKTDKAVGRQSFPKEYKLFDLDASTLKKDLFSIVGKAASKPSVVIGVPDADGNMEEFEIVEASNFEPALQAQFPEIRAFSGRSLKNNGSTIKMSYSPQGIQTMVFRTDTENEFMEPYSADHKVYAVYRSERKKGNLPWTCTTEEKQVFENISGIREVKLRASGNSGGTLKTMRLAQSCNGEYSNYFGAFSSADVGKVLAAFNATLTRCNGCYEKDLALHLNLIANTTAVIYYNPSTDPYTTMSSWNNQLQTTLTNVIGSANYDIGHMFGASGGGGNAGCIGCVCSNGKGSGITSPADGVPMGDNFDIDYVAHEVGHQLGANHTFSMSSEGTGQNKEVGSGITIMGYAGITSQDVAPHSIDIFHETSIAQITTNLSSKTCPVTTNITANNVAPAIGAVSNYTIPISTPFALTASATDANGDALTYCWEQNDNSTTTGNSSVASPTKTTGPNWISFSPTSNPTRLFPKLATILAGLNVSGPLPGGDAIANTEALSSVARTLNFRLTVRDNHAFSSSAPVAVGQTAYTDVVVTVANTGGAFAVTSPNTNITWASGGSATVTWSVGGTTGSPINCASVKILLSTDGGNTFPTVLAASTANDGSEVVTVPNTPGTTNRIKVESIGNIFFDISNTNFTIGAPAACGDPTGLASSSVTQTDATISWNAVSSAVSYDVSYKPSSSSTWGSNINTTATTLNLTGLSANTTYDWRVKANCSGGTGNFVQAQFTTTGTSTPCPGTYDNGANGTSSGAATIPLNTDVKGLINPKNDVDYYRFIITTGGTISISLSTLPADYQLELQNSGGTVLQSSTNSGTTSETINRNVAAGTYFVRIYPKNTGQNNASLCYTLNVTTISASRMSEGEIIANNRKFEVSPNPVRSSLNIHFIAEEAGNATVSLLNQAGAVVQNQVFNVSAGENNRKMNVGNVNTGMYYIKLQTGNTVQMKKIMISK